MKINRAIIFIAVMASLICLYSKVSQAGNSTVPDDFNTIQAAIDDVGTVAGDTITVLAGTYNETLNINKGVTIVGAGVTQTFVTGGIILASGVSRVTLQHIYITSSGSRIISAVGTNDDFTMNNCVVDGEGTTRHGYGGGSMTGDVTITNCEFKDVGGWSLMDARSGSGGGGSAIENVTFANNYIHECDGAIEFRGGDTGTWIVLVNVHDNIWKNINNNSST